MIGLIIKNSSLKIQKNQINLNKWRCKMENFYWGAALGLICGLPILIFVIGIHFVNPNEKADIYRLGVFKRTAKQGFNFLFPLFDKLVVFPSSIQEIDLVSENVMIAAEPGYEEQSQTINVYLLQPFFITNIDLVFKKIGVSNIDDLLEKFFGKMVEEGKRRGGLVGSFMADLLRSYVASSQIKTLDDAYTMRDNLATHIINNLYSRFPELTYGIHWEKTIVSDVKAEDEIEKARGEKAKAAIQRDKAGIDAQKIVITGKAEADAEFARGKVKADIDLLSGQKEAEVELAKGMAKAQYDLAQGKAQAEVDFARGEATAKVSYLQLKAKLDILGLSKDVSQEGAAQVLSVLLFGTEFADKLKGMGNFNVLMTPDIGKMFGSLFGDRKTIDAQEIIKAFMGLSADEKQVIAEKFGQIIGGKGNE